MDELRTLGTIAQLQKQTNKHSTIDAFATSEDAWKVPVKPRKNRPKESISSTPQSKALGPWRETLANHPRKGGKSRQGQSTMQRLATYRVY